MTSSAYEKNLQSPPLELVIVGQLHLLKVEDKARFNFATVNFSKLIT